MVGLSPTISVIIAARNEEDNLPKVLKTLLCQEQGNIPFEVLVGNDNSTDSTWEVIDYFSKQYTNLSGFQVGDYTSTCIAKGRVLEFLIPKAKGEFIAITDADIELPKNWVLSIHNALVENRLDMVSGISVPNEGNWLENFQMVEWLLALHQVSLLEKIGLHLTALGNNFAFRKSAYWDVGGYEAIGATLVEDFALYQAFVKTGKKVDMLFNENLMARTHGVLTFKDLLIQRRRWLIGGLQASWWIKAPFFIQFLWYPVLIVCFLNQPTFLTFLLLALRPLMILVLGNHLKSLLKLREVGWPYFLLFDFYFNAVYLSTFWAGLTKPTTWKGRTY